MPCSRCRFCDTALHYTFVDLGMSPLANSYVKPEHLQSMEPFYPLHVYVCDQCLLVQLEEFSSPEQIFSDYAYFSSLSDSWLDHARVYTEIVVDRFRLGQHSKVVEIGSNDGYLLQYLVQRNIPVLGIEPAANVAEAARRKGINTKVAFFGEKTALELVTESLPVDLIIGNNVLAHVPDLNDFIKGLKILLKSNGVITMEFPHLMRLMAETQFDTIYHEHFSYFSFITVERLFANHGMKLFDVEELPTHGGSLRIFAGHENDTSKPVGSRVAELRSREQSAGFTRLQHYLAFGGRVAEAKRKLLTFLIEAKQAGKSIVGYGAPAKGTTLLNYCGIRTDFLEYTVDRSPHKQGQFLPGVHIPIFETEHLRLTRPDYVLILPWNLKDEIIKQVAYVREWGCQFIVPIPEVQVYL